MLDLAVPRDIDPAVGDCLNVYLYSLDDLGKACEANRSARDKEWPKAMAIIEDETSRFMSDLHHRATGPIIRRVRQGWQGWKDDELKRLFNKLGHLGERDKDEIRQSFDRLMNKLLHPPLERCATRRKMARRRAARGVQAAVYQGLKRAARKRAKPQASFDRG